MKENYKKSITVGNSSHDVFKCLTTGIKDWWSNGLSGRSEKPGDEYRIWFNDTKKRMQVTEIIPDKKVVWLCLEAYIDHDFPVRNEWEGTKMIWDIESNGSTTTLTLTHEGLTPDFYCYDVCSQGWNHFLDSLYQLLTTGIGKPHINKEPQEAIKKAS